MKPLIYKILLLVLIIFGGCIRETPISVNPPDIEGTAKLLRFAEENGDPANNLQTYPAIDAPDVFSNLSNYLILDIRSPQEFSVGHIETAMNLSSSDLLPELESSETAGYEKQILISAFGNKAAYYTFLLRLYGFKNLYFMDFGMAAWNFAFGKIWLDTLQEKMSINMLTNNNYIRRRITRLPVVSYNHTLSSEENAHERIKSLLADNNSPIEISLRELISRYNFTSLVYENTYLICYGLESDFYLAGSSTSGDPMALRGHPYSAVFYNAFADFKSSTFLQTLPKDRQIVLYSYSGQISAYAEAYLKYLGYNVLNLTFGATKITYPRLIWKNTFERWVFTRQKINDFPFISGK